MASVASFDDIINRVGGGYTLNQPIWGEFGTAGSLSVFATTGTPANIVNRLGYTKNMPSSLPTGVTAFIPTAGSFATSNQLSSRGQLLICKMINLGVYDSTTSTWTDGSPMPKVTELNGANTSTWSSVLVEVTTAFNATPGTITITYQDQDSHAEETTAAISLSASAAVGTMQFLGQGTSSGLNTGDYGVTDIVKVQEPGGFVPGGVLKFWGIVPIGFTPGLPIGTNGISTMNLLTADFNLVRLGINDRIDVLRLTATSQASNILGNIFFVGDS